MDRRTVGVAWFATLGALVVLGLTWFSALLGTAVESESVFWDGQPAGACFGWPLPTGDGSFPFTIAVPLIVLSVAAAYLGYSRQQQAVGTAEQQAARSKQGPILLGSALLGLNLIAAAPLGYLLFRLYRVSQTCDNPVTDLGPSTVGQAVVPVIIVGLVAVAAIAACGFVAGIELRRHRDSERQPALQ